MEKKKNPVYFVVLIVASECVVKNIILSLVIAARIRMNIITADPHGPLRIVTETFAHGNVMSMTVNVQC